jgi:predicted transcriptional regulator
VPDKEHVARIIAAFVKRNTLAADELPGVIASVYAALSKVESAGPVEPMVEWVPAVPVRSAVKPNSITCLDCGYVGKMLKRHLMSAHELTPQAYRERWNLKSNSPLVAPSYAARRSELAKSAGLGKQRTGRNSERQTGEPV